MDAGEGAEDTTDGVEGYDGSYGCQYISSCPSFLTRPPQLTLVDLSGREEEGHEQLGGRPWIFEL